MIILRSTPMAPLRLHSRRSAFTLIEMLVVIVIIAILMGLAFPAFQSVQNSAKKAQAKNDLVQIVTAVNAFYTEYGKYPTIQATDTAAAMGPGGGQTNDVLFNELRGLTSTTLNPRGIVFFSPPDAKDSTNPRSGISVAPATAGQLFDPWGTAYTVRIDADFDNQIANPYSQNAGSSQLRAGVIAWSAGKDRVTQTGSDKNAGSNKDDVISWQ